MRTRLLWETLLFMVALTILGVSAGMMWGVPAGWFTMALVILVLLLW